MLIPALLMLSTMAQSEPIATLRLAGTDVPISLPAIQEASPTAPYFQVGEWRYVVQDGEIARREGDLWKWVRGHYAPAKAAQNDTTAIYHMKIVLIPRSTIIDVGRDGFLRERRVVVNDDLRRQMLQGVGQFIVLAETLGRGEIKIDADVSFENENIPIYSDGTVMPYGAEFASWYFGSRINSGGFKADDNLYRGPYESVVYVHTGLTQGYTGILRGMPISGISFFRNAHADEPAGLALALEEAWSSHAAMLAKKAGLGTLASSSSIDDVIPPTSWPSVLATTQEGYRANISGTSAGGEGKTWPQIASNPLGSLPRVDPAGKPTLPFAAAQDAMAVAKNAISVKFLGIGQQGGKNVFVLSEPLQLPELTVPPMKYSELTVLKDLRYSPNIKVSLGESDGVTAVTYQENGQARVGHLDLFQIPAGNAILLQVKSDSAEPLALQLIGPDGGLVKSFVLGRMDPSPRELEIADDSVHLNFKPDNEWHDVTIRIDHLQPVSLLRVAPPVRSTFWERDQIDPITYSFRQIRIGDGQTSEAPFEIKADPHSTDTLSRARAALEIDLSSPQFKDLLEDGERIVVLNALQRLVKEPNAKFETQLVKRANDVDTGVAKAAMEGIYSLKSVASNAYLRHFLESSPFEYNRATAATILSRSKVMTLAGPISQLIAARSWLARFMGAKAIANLEGEEANVILMAFLQEENPMIRLAVTEGSNPAIELVCRRLKFSAERDPSDAVRGASFIKLLQSSLPTYIAVGEQWTADPSESVKLDVLRAIKDKTLKSDANSLAKAGEDHDPVVRAKVVEVLRALSMPIPDALTNDPDPRVQRAIRDRRDGLDRRM